MPQIIASYCHPSQTAASAKVWSGKTLVGTSASVAATARAGLWEFTFASNVPVGWYDIEVFQSTGVAVSNYPVYSDGSSAAIAHNGAAVLDSATQEQIDAIETGVALISTITVVVPSPISEVIGMPETLEIGDSYDDETPIKLYVRDDADDPVTIFSGHDLADLDFDPTFTIAPTPGNPRGRVVGVVTYVPAVGPVEGYLKVEISSLQSRRAVEGESSVQCVLKWDGYEKTLLSTTVRWLPRI